MSRNRVIVLLMAAGSLGPLSVESRAVPIYSSVLKDYISCGGGSSCYPSFYGVTGLNTDQVNLTAGAYAFYPELTDTSLTQDFSFFTAGPVIPGVLTLNWQGNYNGNSSTAHTYDDTVFDWETGSPVAIYSWKDVDGQEVHVPLNLGIPFSVTLHVGASTHVLSLTNPPGGQIIERATISIDPAPVPEPGTLGLLSPALLLLSVAASLENAKPRTRSY